MRRVWQKRKCRAQAEGYFDICHADESKPPTRVNLLTCQIKVVPDDKRGFDLVSCMHKISFFNKIIFLLNFQIIAPIIFKLKMKRTNVHGCRFLSIQKSWH